MVRWNYFISLFERLPYFYSVWNSQAVIISHDKKYEETYSLRSEWSTSQMMLTFFYNLTTKLFVNFHFFAFPSAAQNSENEAVHCCHYVFLCFVHWCNFWLLYFILYQSSEAVTKCVAPVSDDQKAILIYFSYFVIIKFLSK